MSSSPGPVFCSFSLDVMLQTWLKEYKDSILLSSHRASYGQKQHYPPASFVKATVSHKRLSQIANTLLLQVLNDCFPYIFVPIRHLNIWAHTTPATGHPGSQCAFAPLRTKFQLRDMLTDVNKQVAVCTVLTQSKISGTFPALLLIYGHNQPQT